MRLLCYQQIMRLLRATSRVAALLAAASLLSCRPAEDDGNVVNVAANTAAERPTLPVAEPPMDREALLIAAIRSASAQATGSDDSEAQRTLEGRRFEFRLRFGCASEAEDGQTFSVRFDESRRTLRLRAAPDLTGADPLVESLVADSDDPVEGFWLRRPWLLVPTCPNTPRTEAGVEDGDQARRTDVPADEPAVRFARLGIAQFFREGDSRTFQRRQRPYETTKTLAEGEAPSAEGYDLVLSGRLRRLPGGRVIACRSDSPDVPPDCIISVVFDQTRLERPGSREIIAEWSRG